MAWAWRTSHVETPGLRELQLYEMLSLEAYVSGSAFTAALEDNVERLQELKARAGQSTLPSAVPQWDARQGFGMETMTPLHGAVLGGR